MAKCNFSIDFEAPIDELIEKTRKAITQKGGTFDGDSSKGEFSCPTGVGRMAGNYTVLDKTITFIITEKPGVVSCNRIERELRNYLNNPNPPLDSLFNFSPEDLDD